MVYSSMKRRCHFRNRKWAEVTCDRLEQRKCIVFSRNVSRDLIAYMEAKKLARDDGQATAVAQNESHRQKEGEKAVS